jgi:hypothetical protein
MTSDNGSATIGEDFDANAVAGIITEAFEDYVNSHLASSHSVNLTGMDLSPDFHGLPEHQRVQMVCDGRQMVLTNPVAKQVRALWTNYGVGTGFDWRPRTQGAKAIVDAVTQNPDNKCVFSVKGQRKTSDIYLTDGELFWVVFGAGMDAKLRRIDTLEITDIAYDPNDFESSRYYIRTLGAHGIQERKVIYADWRNTSLLDGVLRDGTRVNVKETKTGADIKFIDPRTGHTKNEATPITFAKGASMYHDMFDGTGRRGQSLFIATLPWLHAQNHFMRDRTAIMSALATHAYKAKVKGGQAAVTAMVSQIKSTLSNTNPIDDNPKYTAGSTWVENDSINLEAMKQETGAAAARVDGDMLMNQAGLGAGIFAQYLGRGDLPNYAMANSMEGPMVKQWEAYQEQLEDLYQVLFRVILRGAVKPKAEIVDVDTPELIRKDTPAMVDAITKLYAVNPALAGSDEMTLQLLTLFDIDNPQLVIEQIKAAPKPEPVTAPTTDGNDNDD